MRHVGSLPRRAAGGTAVLAALALAGCGAEAMPTPSPSPSYSSSYLTPPPVELAPLTGEIVEAGALDRPSLAAKIDNHSLARPQVGLDRTDLVFEELVEGGLTRYVAVWHSDVPDEIGPVRSIRPMDPDIVSPLGGIIAYSGGQYRFVVLMQDTPVYNAIHGFSDTADVMYRTRDKIAPHNVLVLAPELIRMHDELDPPAQQFAFAPDLESATAVIEGTAADGASVRFSPASNPSWSYDGESRRWLRSQNGTADTAASGERLSAANVVVLRVPVSSGLGVPKTELIGDGDAWVLSGGHAVEARWSKSSRTGRISLHDENGTVVRLAPGNTWIELMPRSGSVSIDRPASS